MKKIILFAFVLATIMLFGTKSNAEARKPVVVPTPTYGPIYCADSVQGCVPLDK